MIHSEFEAIWRGLREAGVKGASHMATFTDDGTLGTSGQIMPLYGSGDTWQR
jgi:hypothetical protein